MTLITSIGQLLCVCWPQLLAVLLAIRFVRARYKYGLNNVPGPFLASITDLWQLYRAVRGLGIEDYKLHRKYKSPLVRVGPKTVAVSDPDACRTIFGYKPIFKKVSGP